METNNVPINKIISILVAIIVTACVLVPICNELGDNQSNSANKSGSNTTPLEKMARLGYDFEDYWLSDSINGTARDYVEQEGSVYNIRFIPGQDGRSYSEDELVLLCFDGLNAYAMIPTCEITYSEGMFHIIGNDDNWDEFDIDCIGFILGLELTDGTYIPYIIPLESVDDSTIYDYTTDGVIWKGNITYGDDNPFFMMAFAKLLDQSYNGDTVYITDNPDVTIKIDDLMDYFDTNEDYENEPFEYDSENVTYYFSDIDDTYIGYYTSTPLLDGSRSLDTFLPSTIFSENDIHIESPSAFGLSYVAYDDISDEIIEHGQEDISLNKWKGWEFNLEADVTVGTPYYLIFDTDIPYSISGSEPYNGGSDGSSNVTGTIIQIIPVLVILSILAGIAYTLLNPNKVQ